MYINLKSLNVTDCSTIRYQCVSINQIIGDIKKDCFKLFNVDLDSRIRLFFHGKELRDELTLLDYGIKINEIVHFCNQKIEVNESIDNNKENNQGDELVTDIDKTNDVNEKEENNSYTVIEKDDYYAIGDHVDCLHPEIGAWFEGKIVNLYRSNETNRTVYEVKFWKSSLPETVKVTINGVRPQSNQQIRLSEIKPGDLLLANSNLTNPGQMGYWYDYLVTSINIKRKIVQGILFIGDKVTLDNHCLTGSSIFYLTRDNLPAIQRNNQQNKLIANGS